MVDSNLGLYRIAEEMDWGSPPSSLYSTIVARIREMSPMRMRMSTTSSSGHT